MLNDIIKQVAFQLLVRAVREEDDEIKRELLGSYWDLKYLYLFGIPEMKVPVPSLIDPLQDPTPTPVVNERLRLHEDILFGLMDGFFGDPSPQPSLFSLLKDRDIRIKAAKGLVQRLNTSIEQLNKEIEGLEKEKGKG